MNVQRHSIARFAPLALLLVCTVPALAQKSSVDIVDEGSVQLECSYHYTYANGGAADQEVHLGVDYASGLVRIYSAPGDRGDKVIPVDARFEGDTVVYRAFITDDTIKWSGNDPSGLGAALEPNQVAVRQAIIDRKTGRFSLVFDPRYTYSAGTGMCAKRSDTNKF